MRDKYTTAVLLHWNAERQREEHWLLIEFRGHYQNPSGNTVFEQVCGRKPLCVIDADSYLNGSSASGRCGWLAGPLTEEEANSL